VKPATALENRFEPEPVWAKEIETEFLVTSRRAAQMNAQQMLWADRRYWGIETGLHLRLDVIAGEDRSRVRNRTSAIKPSTS
jgi:predicted transposase YbfD/YdcC